MTAKQKELCDIVETLSDDISCKVIDYIEFLQYTSIMKEIPETLLINNKEDLRRMIKEGIKASEENEVYSADDVFNEIESKLKTEE